VIPPEQNADFVAHMEDVLEVYKRPYSSDFPVVCMDEQPIQLVQESRKSIPPSPGSVERFDYEYERMGTTNNFMFTEPLSGWRKVNVRDRKTGRDWAEEIEQLLNIDYPGAEKIILVCDNLITHRVASLYERYPPEIARGLVERLEIHYTPKHGSWLNIAEIELSALTKQCLDRYISNRDILQAEVKTWATKRNELQKGVDWQFTTADARIKLKRLYPQYQS
jgi:hypothetical protein